MPKFFTQKSFNKDNVISLASSYDRLNGQPLYIKQVWADNNTENGFEQLCDYAKSNQSYVGEILSHINGTGNVTLYYISDKNGTIKEVGSRLSSDNIDIVNNLTVGNNLSIAGSATLGAKSNSGEVDSHTIIGNLKIEDGGLNLTSETTKFSVDTSGNTSVGGTLDVTNETILKNNLTIKNGATNKFTVAYDTGNTDIAGNLKIGNFGDAKQIDLYGDFKIYDKVGASKIYFNTTSDGFSTVNINGDLKTTGAVNVNSDLKTVGEISSEAKTFKLNNYKNSSFPFSISIDTDGNVIFS